MSAEKIKFLGEAKARLSEKADVLDKQIEQMKKAYQRKATIDRVREQLQRKYQEIEQIDRDIESLRQLNLFN